MLKLSFVKILLSIINAVTFFSQIISQFPGDVPNLPQARLELNTAVRYQTWDAKYNGVAIDSGFSKHVEHLIQLWNVTGLSLVVVKPEGDTEFGNWGIKTEDGEPVTSDVSRTISFARSITLVES